MCLIYLMYARKTANRFELQVESNCYICWFLLTDWRRKVLSFYFIFLTSILISYLAYCRRVFTACLYYDVTVYAELDANVRDGFLRKRR